MLLYHVVTLTSLFYVNLAYVMGTCIFKYDKKNMCNIAMDIYHTSMVNLHNINESLCDEEIGQYVFRSLLKYHESASLALKADRKNRS